MPSFNSWPHMGKLKAPACVREHSTFLSIDNYTIRSTCFAKGSRSQASNSHPKPDTTFSPVTCETNVSEKNHRQANMQVRCWRHRGGLSFGCLAFSTNVTFFAPFQLSTFSDRRILQAATPCTLSYSYMHRYYVIKGQKVKECTLIE